MAGGVGAALAGGAAVASHTGGVSVAAPSAQQDARLLNLFLTLERLQEGLYGQATESGAVSGQLLRFAAAAARQERAHVRLLADRLGDDADKPPESDFTQAMSSHERFGRAAIDLEEAALQAYIAHGASLTRDAIAAVVPIVSVDARHAAWVRDVMGVDPAPRAADPPRESEEILDGLRAKGLLA
jgi:hypothetical protein